MKASSSTLAANAIPLKLDLTNLRGDFFGGITAGVITLPLALAFGQQSGLGAVAGLYCAIFLGIIAAVFGGTPTMVSTPTGPMTVVSALVIAKAVAMKGSIGDAMGTILAIFVLAGLFQVMFGAFKFGRYVRYIPYTVISGFMTGIGLILIFIEINPFLGLHAEKNLLTVIMNLSHSLGHLNPQAVELAVLTMGIIYLMPRLTKAIPGTLVALVAGTLIANLGHYTVPLLGSVPQGIPDFQLQNLLGADLSKLSFMLTAALTLAALGCIDSLLTSVIADNVTKTRHDSDRELIGQGFGNMLSALFGGMVGAGTTMSTLVNIRAGGRHNLSGIISALFLVIVLLGAGHYAAYIPIPVLAGILMTVGISIIDYKGLKHLARITKGEAAVLLIVIFMTVFVDLIEAVAVGMVLSCLLFMKRMGDIAEENSEVVPLNCLKLSHPHLLKEGVTLPEELHDKVYVKTLDGPLFFGFSHSLDEKLKEIPDIKIIILEMSRVPYVDQSGAYALESVILEMHERGVEVLIANIQEQPAKMLHKLEVFERLDQERHLFENIFDCFTWLEKEIIPGIKEAMAK